MNVADRSGPDAQAVLSDIYNETGGNPVGGFPHVIHPNAGCFGTGYQNFIGATLTWVASGFQCRKTLSGYESKWYTTWIWANEAKMTAGSNEIGTLDNGFGSSGLSTSGEMCDAMFVNNPGQKLIFRLRMLDKDTTEYSVAPAYKPSLLDAHACTRGFTDIWTPPSNIAWGWPPPVVQQVITGNGFEWPHGITVHSFTMELGS